MSNTVKLVMAMGLAAFVAACGQSQSQPPETVIVEPVMAEQPTTKY